jgi:2-methylcitrate dehydratase PrpD
VQFFHSGSTVKRLHAAQAASSGVKAALLVQSGFSGPTDIFEGQDGFARAYSDSMNLQALEGLGKDYQITEVAIKPHATSARVLSAIEAANTLCLEHAIQSGQIIAITLGIPKVIQGRLTSTSPKDIQSAQMSAPFCVALSIFKSTPSSQLVINVDDVEQGLHHPEVMRLCELVQCQLDPDVEKTSTNESVSAKLTMQLKNGQTLFTQVNAPKGSPSRPYSTLDHQLGAMTELGRRYSKSTTQEIISLVKNFSTLTDIQTLTNLLQ